MLIDSHCHLTDKKFGEDRDAVLLRAREVGVEKILCVASTREDSERVVGLVAADLQHPESPELWGSAGIHPHDAEEALEGDLEAIRGIARRTPRIVAIGETGLDFYYDNSPRAIQESLFREHLALAEDLGLPVIVHSRSADEATGRILSDWGGRVPGVLHCYTGEAELLALALRLGWMISFTGIITFRKYDGRALVRAVPRDRLMVETDAPYLAPVPHRGKRNEPAFVTKVAEALAEIREEPVQEVLNYTGENAVRFFGMDSP
jgi:TatD DNase family protein